MWSYKLLLGFSTVCSGPKPFKRPLASESNETYKTFESLDLDWNSLNQILNVEPQTCDKVVKPWTQTKHLYLLIVEKGKTAVREKKCQAKERCHRSENSKTGENPEITVL